MQTNVVTDGGTCRHVLLRYAYAVSGAFELLVRSGRPNIIIFLSSSLGVFLGGEGGGWAIYSAVVFHRALGYGIVATVHTCTIVIVHACTIVIHVR